jgi:hypothetical protein
MYIEADARDLAVLLSAKQVAGAAKLQVERCDLEARAEVAELLQSGESLARHFAQLGVGGNKQVRIGPAVRSSDAASKLVEL